MSVRKTNEQFQKEAMLNTKVTVLDVYEKLSKKILVKCNKCGNEYYTLPKNVIDGHGCRKCADKENQQRMKLTKQEFLERLTAINPNFTLVGEYVKNSIPVTILCLNCGKTFTISPSNLFLRGARCPNCTSHPLSKTQEEFEHEVYIKNPDILISGIYTNNQSYIHCKCKKCNYEWESKAT